MNSIPEDKPLAALIVCAETNTRAFPATTDALGRNRTPRFDTVVRKRQDIKAAMGHKSVKLWEYAQVLTTHRRGTGMRNLNNGRICAREPRQDHSLERERSRTERERME